MFNNMMLLHQVSKSVKCPSGATQFSDIYIPQSTYYNDTNNIVGNICFPECTYIEDAEWYDPMPGEEIEDEYLGAFGRCTLLQQITMPKCSYIGSNTFEFCSNLSNANFPKCNDIGMNAFLGCSLLSSVYFPSISQLNCTIFYNCSLLSDITKFSTYFPALPNTTVSASVIDHNAFGGTGITSAIFPNCTSIRYQAFEECDSLTTISFPKCTYIGYAAFIACNSLSIVSFPQCSYIGYRAFDGCSSISIVSFPQCSYIEEGAFIACNSLSIVSFPQCNYIGEDAFMLCTSLSTIYIGTSISTVCNLYNSSAFYFTGITPSTGSIYVPASLLTEYQSASGWSYFSTQIIGI